MASGVTLSTDTDYVFNVVATDSAKATASIEVTVEVDACDAVWCAELTAETYVISGDTFAGYETGSYGQLLPSRAISVGGVTYPIIDLSDDASTPYLGFSDIGAHLVLNDQRLSLAINAGSFALDSDSAELGGYFEWTITGGVFTNGSTHQVKITQKNVAPSFPATETGARTVDENTAGGTAIGAAVAANDDDDLTYSLSGTDSASFTIDAGSGQLSVGASTVLDYETKKSYTVTVGVSDSKDSAGVADSVTDATIEVTITVTDVNDAPVIAGLDEVTFEIDENEPVSTAVGTVFVATDQDGDAITWSLTALSGDAALFSRSSEMVGDESRQQLLTAAALNYEAKATRTFTLRASDPSRLSDTVEVTVTVNNLKEPGVISFDSASPQVGAKLTVSLTEPDGGEVITAWQWASSSDWDPVAESGDWSEIDGATAVSYTPEADDVDKYLRATAIYTDHKTLGSVDPEEASGVTDSVAMAAAVTDATPTFGSETVPNQTYSVGASIQTTTPTEATGGDGTLTYTLTPEVSTNTAGLTFNATARTLTGTPTTSEVAETYTVTDGDQTAPDTATLTFTIEVKPASRPSRRQPPATAR